MRGTAWAASVTAAVLLAAGCGTARYHAAGHGPGAAASSRPGSSRPAGPATITRQQAERLARELLSRAPVPGGARRLAGPPVKVLGQPQGVEAASPSVELHELWTAAQPMNAVDAFLTRNVPAGMTLLGTGQSGREPGGRVHAVKPGRPPAPAWGGSAPPGRAGTVIPGRIGTITSEFVSYQLQTLPAGVSAATLGMQVASAGRGASELRADVEVIWYPPRSAAEHVPAGMHAVTITASYFNREARGITRTFTSQAVVGRLAAMLNAAPASTAGAMSCPMIQVTYRLAFASAARAAPYLVAVDGGCLSLGVTVLGHAQPALQEPAALRPLLARLLYARASLAAATATPAHLESPRTHAEEIRLPPSAGYTTMA